MTATEGTYRNPVIDEAFERAVRLLEEKMSEWSTVVEAYFLLRRHEDEIGFPFTYNMVEEIVNTVHERVAGGRTTYMATVKA